MTLHFEKDLDLLLGLGTRRVAAVSYGSNGRKWTGNRMKDVIPDVYGCGS